MNAKHNCSSAKKFTAIELTEVLKIKEMQNLQAIEVIPHDEYMEQNFEGKISN